MGWILPEKEGNCPEFINVKNSFIAKKKKSGSLFLKILFLPLQVVAVFLLPFFVLIRLSIFLSENTSLNVWLCFTCGIILTAGILLLYFSWILKKIKGKKKLSKSAKKNRWIYVGLTLGIYLLYGLTFISSDNAKTRKIKEEYGSLHPFLRMGVGTVALFDKELVITDLKRELLDYEHMGLGKKSKSLHFVQSDGYVHAIDMRTLNRAEWRNTFLNLWFRSMGFKVHRHSGTADHLHISLGIKENRDAW